jgi:hypothetical protein
MGLIVQPLVEEPLRQGDILENVLLYETAAERDEAVPILFDHVLVLSRNCNAVREQTVIVAAIDQVTPPDFLARLDNPSLDQLRQRIATVRDGDGNPDRFYLGPLPGSERRVFALLDRIYAIQVPEKEPARQEWVRVHRRATLSNDHRRHLHVSLLLAFGREGFDDFAWWPDADLKLMINVGKKALAKTSGLEADIERERQAAIAEPNEKKSEGQLKDNAHKAQNVASEKEKTKKALAPYVAEWKRRHNEDPLA